jgi:hypothetical protein
MESKKLNRSQHGGKTNADLESYTYEATEESELINKKN